MTSIFGYIRTSRRLQEGVPGMDPASQKLQLRRAGVPLANIHRDVGISGTIGTQGRQGWHQLDGRLAGGDTLVVVAIDRIGRRWPDTIKSICELRDRGVKVSPWPLAWATPPPIPGPRGSGKSGPSLCSRRPY